MSERKTDEIKFRVTPSEKAAWQARADVEEIGLSELIRRATNSTLEMKASPEDRPDIAWVELTPEEQAQAAAIVDAAVERRAPQPVESLLDAEDLEVINLDAALSATDHVPGRDCAWSPCPTCGHLTSLTDTAQAALEAYGSLPVVLSEEMPPGMCLITNITDAAPQDVSASDKTPGISKEDADRLVADGKASWMFEARNA